MRNSKSHFTFFVLLVFLLSNTFTFASGTKRPKPDSEGSIDEIPKREKVKEDEISDENDFGQRYQPKTNTTWHWHLDSEAIYKFPVDLYDIDLFLNSAKNIQALKRKGVKVICYFSAGSWEPYRPDSQLFPQSVLGKSLVGWEDEKWLDVRQSKVRELMLARLDLAKEKGCDGVEPDNIDGYTHDTGFNLTPAQQRVYQRFLAIEAQKRNLAIAYKNDVRHVPLMAELFDFALNESCHQYNECEVYQSFTKRGKVVLNAEYDKPKSICQKSKKLNMRTVIFKGYNLNGTRFHSCDDD